MESPPRVAGSESFVCFVEVAGWRAARERRPAGEFGGRFLGPQDKRSMVVSEPWLGNYQVWTGIPRRWHQDATLSPRMSFPLRGHKMFAPLRHMPHVVLRGGAAEVEVGMPSPAVGMDAGEAVDGTGS